MAFYNTQEQIRYNSLSQTESKVTWRSFFRTQGAANLFLLYKDLLSRSQSSKVINNAPAGCWYYDDELFIGKQSEGFMIGKQSILKELRHDLLSHFFEGRNYDLSVAKPKYNSLLRKKNSKGVILEQKGTRMAEDGEDWNGLEMTVLKNFANFSKIHKRWHSSFKPPR